MIGSSAANHYDNDPQAPVIPSAGRNLSYYNFILAGQEVVIKGQPFHRRCKKPFFQ